MHSARCQWRRTTLDLTEAVDSDGDGLMDVFEDGDLVPNAGTDPFDSDLDSVDDFLDLDSDDDGIPDTVEAFPTAGYATNDGDVTNDDTDGDGVLDAFDSTPGHGADFSVPENTDGADNPDFLDDDSDNDGLTDAVESGLTPGADIDGDGIGDGVNASYADPDGDVDVPSTDLDNQIDDTTEVGYREFALSIGVEKEPTATVAATSGTPGNFDVTYEFVIENTGTLTLDNLTLTEDLATEMGGAFIRLVGTPSITPGTGAVAPTANGSFDGGATDAEVFDGTSGEIEAGEMVTVQITVELDPDAATATYNAGGELENSATVGGRIRRARQRQMIRTIQTI